ncbi:hypothetical protein HXX76_000055 [Chlamydomonas incerta]|uniref:Uncharacterized protein n=1 Tax=Chlamydomonas incerta TaxID=51695 RepID=A0A835WDH7_CHLIN|nr:hypothetical protein HXX76_000055 [Chlamydomonas incerta]|eukprot:KAG2445435.1 hypothetical protein HXX76_000055 [Chlamydomonas incerta]
MLEARQFLGYGGGASSGAGRSGLGSGWVVAAACLLPLVVLVLPAALELIGPETGASWREGIVRLTHVALVAALCLYGAYGGRPGGGGGGGDEAWQLPLQAAGRALASLVVVLQPASYGMRFANGYCCWVLDALLLTLVHWRSAGTLEAERGGGSGGRSGGVLGGGAERWGVCWAPASWVGAVAPAVAAVLASGALTAVVDAAWRLHFLRRYPQQRPGSQPRREARSRQ